MKLRITRKVFDLCEPAIEDSVARRKKSELEQKTDSVYLKMHDYDQSAKWRGHFTIECNADEAYELEDRAEYQIEVCQENIEDCSRSERPYYMAEIRAWRGLLKQISEQKNLGAS